MNSNEAEKFSGRIRKLSKDFLKNQSKDNSILIENNNK